MIPPSANHMINEAWTWRAAAHWVGCAVALIATLGPWVLRSLQGRSLQGSVPLGFVYPRRSHDRRESRRTAFRNLVVTIGIVADVLLIYLAARGVLACARFAHVLLSEISRPSMQTPPWRAVFDAVESASAASSRDFLAARACATEGMRTAATTVLPVAALVIGAVCLWQQHKARPAVMLGN